MNFNIRGQWPRQANSGASLLRDYNQLVDAYNRGARI
jgi:hypothetical protein